MILFILLVITLVSLLTDVHVHATPLDDYVWEYDEHYSWVDLDQVIYFSPLPLTLYLSL